MQSTVSCSRCGSTKIVPRARVIDRGEDYDESGSVRIGVARRPDAWILKGEQRSDIHARICGDCGVVELFVQDAGAIYGAYLASLNKSGGA